jgi:GNAT superfamily N-acetyltransferase
MIEIRRATPADAPAIGAVHVAAWRSAYPGILPDSYLAGLSAPRQAGLYAAAIRSGVGVNVATQGTRIVGFTTATRARRQVAEGEVETLYVLDDARDQGVGRRLLGASAAFLSLLGCRSAFAWVLRDNPSRWFYARLGARLTAEETVAFAGVPIVQCAYVWPDIATLTDARPT